MKTIEFYLCLCPVPGRVDMFKVDEISDGAFFMSEAVNLEYLKFRFAQGACGG